jgi:hypothetical protein
MVKGEPLFQDREDDARTTRIWDVYNAESYGKIVGEGPEE